MAYEAAAAVAAEEEARTPRTAAAKLHDAEDAQESGDELASRNKVAVKKSVRTEKAAELPPPSPGYRWITLSAGKEDGLAPRDVVDAITEGGEVDGKSVGLIKLHDRETHVQVKATVAAAVVEALEGATLGDKELSVHFARAGAPPRSRKAAEERSERPAFRRDEDRERRTDDRPRRDYGGFRKPDRPYEKKPGGFGGRPGGFRKSYGDREERPGGFRKESPGFAKKPGGYFKKPGGFRKEGGSYGAKPSGFRQYGETRSGDTRSWSKEERPSSEGRSYSPRREDDRPYSPRPPRKSFGGPKKGPGRW
jgi:hypothetical protein